MNWITFGSVYWKNSGWYLHNNWIYSENKFRLRRIPYMDERLPSKFLEQTFDRNVPKESVISWMKRLRTSIFPHRMRLQIKQEFVGSLFFLDEITIRFNRRIDWTYISVQTKLQKQFERYQYVYKLYLNCKRKFTYLGIVWPNHLWRWLWSKFNDTGQIYCWTFINE